jgi:hypothetical protein
MNKAFLPSPLSPLHNKKPSILINFDEEMDILSEKISKSSITNEVQFGFETPKKAIINSAPIPVEFEHADAKEKQSLKRKLIQDLTFPILKKAHK